MQSTSPLHRFVIVKREKWLGAKGVQGALCYSPDTFTRRGTEIWTEPEHMVERGRVHMHLNERVSLDAAFQSGRKKKEKGPAIDD